MTSKNLWLGILAIALVFVLVLTGCENGIQEKEGGSGVPAGTSPNPQVTYTLVKGGVLFTWPLIKDANNYQVWRDNVTLTTAVTLINGMVEYTASTKDLAPDTPYTYAVIALEGDNDIGKWEKKFTPKKIYPTTLTVESDGIGSVVTKITPGSPSYETEPLKIKQIVPDFSEKGTWPANSPIVVFFDDVIYQDSIKNCFKVMVGEGDSAEEIFGTINVSSTVDNSGFSNAILTFTPYEPFEINKNVKITISGLEDKCGNKMNGSETIEFKAEKPNITVGGFTEANFGFESGLAGIEFLGDGNIITGDGTLQPKSGSKLAAITTGLKKVSTKDSIGQKSSIMKLGPIYKEFTKLSFWYNFMSSEFNTYVGTKYNDEATITIDGPNGKVSVSLTSVTKIGKLPEAKKYSGKYLTGGYQTGMTQFVLNKINVGTPAYITFMVSDVGDTVVDSILAVDDIVLSSGGSDNDVAFNSATASGTSPTTAQLMLTFSQPIPELSAADINLSGVSGVNKGETLNGTGPTYTLPISGITAGGELGIAVAKKGYTISGSPKTVTIFNFNITQVAFTGVTQDGNEMATTKKLTLTFDKDIVGLNADDITFNPGQTGAVKGNLSKKETGIYELAVSGINASGSVTVTIADKQGYTITPTSKSVNIYYYSTSQPVQVAFTGLTHDGNDITTTTKLTLAFNKDIDGLNTDDITLNPGQTGAVKGNLSKKEGGIYELAVSGIKASGSVTVTIADKQGYTISPKSKSVDIYYYSLSQPATFTGLTANGSVTTATTTKLTLTFNKDIDGLIRDNITLNAGQTGANKGDLSKTGTGTYELAVSGISASGSVTLTISKTGYTITPSSREVNVYFKSSGGGDVPFTSIPDMAAWLAAQPANTADKPYSVKLNVAALGGSAFTSGSAGAALMANNTKYVSLDLSGSTFTSIAESSFSVGDSGFTNLTNITIPKSVTSIGDVAFGNCTSLASVTIGSGVTSISSSAFMGCTSLTVINVDTGNTAYISQDGVLYNKDKTTLIQYPTGKIGTTFTIPNSVTSIGGGAFMSCSSITSITIPASVTSIGSSAFYGCTTLTSVTFQNTITEANFNQWSSFLGDLRTKYLATAGGGIGTYTTTAPVSSTSVWTKQGSSVINDGPFTSIADMAAWLGAQPANDLYKPYTVKLNVSDLGSNPDDAGSVLVKNSTKYVSLDLSDSTIEHFGNKAFWRCPTLTSVIIGSSVKSIVLDDADAFTSCANLTSVTFKGIISAENFISTTSFDGDLRAKYLVGGIGTYTRSGAGTTASPYTWTKQ